MKKNVLSRLRPAVPVLLVIAGLMLVAVGVGMMFVPAGVIVGGLGCFVLEWRLDR